MIMWTLLLLLTACVLEESTKRYISETIVINLSKTSLTHVISLLQTSPRKTAVYECAFQEVFNHDTGEGIFPYLQYYALAVYDEFESAKALVYGLTRTNRLHYRKKKPNLDAVAKAIQKAARSSYRLPKTVNDSINQILSISITSMKALESQIKEFDKAISAQMELLKRIAFYSWYWTSIFSRYYG